MLFRCLAILLLLSSASFPIVAEQCPAVYEQCISEACEKAGGVQTATVSCMSQAGYDDGVYQQELGKCEATNEYCIGNDGLVRNMSCCGPVFLILSVLSLALRADGRC